MFAFVIWDRNKRELFGARDIFGIKPFFYFKKGKKFIFGSQIKSFLANPQFEKDLNVNRLPDYLCFEYIPTNETMFRNVYKVTPGTCFTVKDGKFTEERYFTPQYDIDDEKSVEYWADLIDSTFKASTKSHAFADVEVGCFLSSGVDSSFVVHEMAKQNKIKTFSVGYAEEKYSSLHLQKNLPSMKAFQTLQRKLLLKNILVLHQSFSIIWMNHFQTHQQLLSTI